MGVLRGAYMVMADLSRAITLPVQLDFMAVSSYGSGTRSSGVVRILKDLDKDITGRDVVVVEDIIDSGLTLSWLLRNLRSREPASVEVLALLRKPDAAKVDVPVKYMGFDIPNEFVVGYGLDYAERYRNLPYVGTLKPAIYRPEPVRTQTAEPTALRGRAALTGTPSALAYVGRLRACTSMVSGSFFGGHAVYRRMKHSCGFRRSVEAQGGELDPGVHRR